MSRVSTSFSSAAGRVVATVAAFAAATGLSGCITQGEYQEQVRNAENFQLLYQDLLGYVDELQAELDRTRAEAETRALVEAGALIPADPALEARKAELEERIAELDGGVGVLKAVEVEGGYGFSLAESVVFDSARAELREQGRTLLLDLARQIAAGDEFAAVWIRGHSDSMPVRREETLQRFPHGNLQLSAARAVEVAALLTGEGGLPVDKVMIAGFGPSRPIADNDTPEGRSLNRRVEIFVIEDLDGADLRGGF